MKSAATARIRVLLADDHAILREGIKLLLESAGDIEVVDQVGDGRAAVKRASQLRPDVVLMDMSLPALDGLEATRQIRRDRPEVKVLFLTMHESEEYFFRALQAGASGYVVKRAAPTDLVEAVRVVRRGGTFLYPSLAKALVSDWMARAQRGEEADSYQKLSPREREILQLLAEGSSNQQIAGRLFLSIKTVQAHRSHLMEKLGLSDVTQLVRYAIRRGLISVEG